jgi:hypothetical protein
VEVVAWATSTAGVLGGAAALSAAGAASAATELPLAEAGWLAEGLVWAKVAKLQATSPTSVKMHSFRFIDLNRFRR